MMEDIQVLSQGRHQSQRSTVDCLLAMQQEEWTDLKRFDWMKNLTCLTLDMPRTLSATWSDSQLRGDNYTLYEIQADIFDSQDLHLVTVSYSWTAAQHHSSKEGAYRIVGLAGDIRAVRVRNTVMRRALQFVSQHGLRGFWIDRECLDQEDKISHRRSMQSMDRLYAISPISVGLVDTVINEQWKLDTLGELLNGSMVGRLDRGENAQESLIDIWVGIKWFSRLLSDRWWRRAWIFQEEYCAARRMRLLIRCYRSLKRSSTTDFGTMLDEVEISAVDFRERLSELYWKCRHGFKLTAKQLDFFQKHVLRRAERYSRTCAERQDQRAQTLSTILMSDLLNRDLCRPTDLLAISANCCAYTRRLNQPKLESIGDKGIALALFSQALLNGEVLYNQAKFTSSPCLSFAEFFRRHIFTGITPPTTVRNLTFTKHCRFSGVSLTQEGVITKGHLWRVVERLKATQTYDNQSVSARQAVQPQNPWAVMLSLSEQVERSHPILAEQIREYVEHVTSHNQSGGRYCYAAAMCAEVAEAWRQQAPLFIARLKRSDRYAIVTVPGKRRRVPTWIFTSHHVPSETDLKEPMEKHVSFEVDLQPQAKHQALPRANIVRWINGLYMCDDILEQSTLFPWPPHFRKPGWPGGSTLNLRKY